MFAFPLCQIQSNFNHETHGGNLKCFQRITVVGDRSEGQETELVFDSDNGETGILKQENRKHVSDIRDPNHLYRIFTLTGFEFDTSALILSRQLNEL